jgi:Protein of unknown function (DUF3108)
MMKQIGRNLLQISFFLLTAACFAFSTFAQETAPPKRFVIGEKLTYKVDFNNFTDVGYGEIYVLSRGKLQEINAVEIRSIFKTTGIAEAFYPFNESRTIFAATETGLPLYVKKLSNNDFQATEKIQNFTLKPTANFDLITAIYQASFLAGTGSFTFNEGENTYEVALQNIGKSRAKTEVGEFDTFVSTVQSSYFTENGIKDLRITFSNDDRRLPLIINFKTAKGNFRCQIASSQIILPETPEVETPTVTPTPTPVPTPFVVKTPRPTPTPAPIKENQPLSTDLPFQLGESLTYNLTANKTGLGKLTLLAKGRKTVNKRDGLTLALSLNSVELMISIVDPESLAPYVSDSKFSGIFAKFNRQILFDQILGTANQVEVPIGTYDLLSFAYAIRSINLKPSKNPANPVNDTRVAVFINDRPQIFSVRPLNTEIVEFNGRKISAQVVALSTGEMQIDQYNPRLWLSNDNRRLPLKFTVSINGKLYQADLIEVKK